ncbi:MinD/ParA family protein [Tomitella fengzijianii]|uniref:AAA family ATPase n=1 Tax=Tomitella fengzijianii TaxID=2597660 RepID=A0A516X581_9ACTN|nr:MinD/ParA family protein [Tomitella fengzijianii]QDQ98173.1 AAA family ATPase [Tomitella fengzijianii]
MPDVGYPGAQNFGSAPADPPWLAGRARAEPPVAAQAPDAQTPARHAPSVTEAAAPLKSPAPSALGKTQAPTEPASPAAARPGTRAPARPSPEPRTPAHQQLSDLDLLQRSKRPPSGGWRRAVHVASGRLINPGESRADAAHRELVARIDQPIRGDYRIAVLSLKGGVGKTTTTIGLGSTFASVRGDRVIAVDANPDLGTLGQRVRSQTTSTARGLLEDPRIRRYSDVRAHTSQARSRLEVIASEKDPAVSEAFSEQNYRSVLRILQSYYNIVLTDCGTGLMHSAMAGVLDTADSLVLVTSPAIDGARSALATLDWLEHHDRGDLVEGCVVVINSAGRGSNAVKMPRLQELFAGRCRVVHTIPFDPHLAEGSEVDLDLLGRGTRRAFLELAAVVAEGFSLPRR